MPDTLSIKQYACDYCRKKKLRCSRETPKCSNCKPWSSECSYSRQGTIPRRSRVRKSNVNSDSGPSTAATSKALENSSTFTAGRNLRHIDNYSECIEPEDRDELDSLEILTNPDESFCSASFLSQASLGLKQLKIESGDETDASASLLELSRSFGASSYHHTDARQTVRNFRRQNDEFYIPGEIEGQKLIEVFTKALERGVPFFSKPPDSLLPRLAFDPSNVDERSWLVVFYALPLTEVSLESPIDTNLRKSLEWNLWLALDNSSLYLETSEITIQALTLVATHCQNAITPTVSWNMISHACRMAQALNLHLPSTRYPKNSPEYQHRLCLFWALYTIDKSMSLAFGRPPFLPEVLYSRLALPDKATLALFKPHISEESASEISSQLFGSWYVVQSFKLSRTIGRASDLVQSTTRLEQTEAIKAELRSWMDETSKASSQYQTATAEPNQQKAITLGTAFLEFQYHHLIVYLTQSSHEDQTACLESARRAISLLEGLVSNSIESFNGIIWQLLYFPFLPFFVIFRKTISDPLGDTRFTDLQLLRKVVLYFLQMHNNHPSAAKLEKIAGSFAKLAEEYVRASMKKITETGSSQVALSNTTFRNGGKKTPDNHRRQHYGTFQRTKDDFPGQSYESMELDALTLLGFLGSDGLGGHINGTEQSLATDETVDTVTGFAAERDYIPTNHFNDPLLSELETRFGVDDASLMDCSFDWFSWEQFEQQQ